MCLIGIGYKATKILCFNSMTHIKKILLINPPIQDFYQTEIRQQPLGLKYLQAVLEKAGYTVFLLDCLDSEKKQTIALPKHFHYLKKYYPTNDLSPFKLFTHYRHFGLGFDGMAEQIKSFQPDIIGISANFTPHFDLAAATAKICKSVFLNVPVVAGGHHATAVPGSVLKIEFFDYVIMGEGEERFIKLINILSQNDFHSLKNLDGIAYRSGTKILINPMKIFIENLNQLPILKIEKDIGMLITSRGCPKSCSFCSISKVMGKKMRFRSIDSVLAEMRTGIENGVRHFDFEDDNFTFNKNHIKGLLQEIIRHFGNYHVTLSAMNGLLADTLDEELIQLMKVAGFEWLNIPLVSGSPKIQEDLNRNQSREKFSTTVSWAKKYNLKVVAYLILGLPEGTLDQMLDDILFLAELPVLIGPSIFYPPPGSEVFTQCIKRGLITGTGFSRYRSSAFSVETENFSRQDLVTLFRIVRVINFLKKLIDEHLTSDLCLVRFIDSVSIKSNDLKFSQKLSQDEIGILLIGQLWQHQKLRGLSLKNQKQEVFLYDWIDYQITPTLVADFLNKINRKKITGIIKPFHFELSD
ncbi:B12-binding domain-containing radical SAM protein [candidate division KSB1 bacterium]|nr:B12-binding domain-containing radical SAM protein [candidate division KSB1 bacterium]